MSTADGDFAAQIHDLRKSFGVVRAVRGASAVLLRAGVMLGYAAALFGPAVRRFGFA